jgi:hypothetical protein
MNELNAGGCESNTQMITSPNRVELVGLQEASPAAAPTEPTYRHFVNTPRRILSRQNYNPFGGGQMVVFG